MSEIIDNVEVEGSAVAAVGSGGYGAKEKPGPHNMSRYLLCRQCDWGVHPVELSGVAEGGEGKFCVPPMDLGRSCSHFLMLPVTPEGGDAQKSLTKFPHFHIPEHTIADKVLIPNQIISQTNKDKVRLTIANLNDHPVKIDNVYASGRYVKATFSPRVVLPNSERNAN